VTRDDGSTVSKVSDVTVGQSVRVRLSDGSLDATISRKNGES
jgi:exonuclease VII large subunit